MLLIKQAEIYSTESRYGKVHLLDLRCREGKIVAIAPSLDPNPGEKVIQARGGVLCPGLHDHHMHLFALAASLQSVDCSPAKIDSLQSLAAVLSKADGNGWVRGIGYHESIAGLLHRSQLDDLLPDRPVRIQHRSGKMWFLNSLAAELLKLDHNHAQEGIELDANGQASGRLFRMDHWLRTQLDQSFPPDIKLASKHLASFGITGITDTSYSNDEALKALLCKLINQGDLMQKVRLMGQLSLLPANHTRLQLGAYKVLLDDYRLPDFDDLIRQIGTAHDQNRSVAIHCVTEVELVFALSALKEAGSHSGDRIEHASITPDHILPLLKETGVTVVTQPNFIQERGDQYIEDLDNSDHALLYRANGFLQAGIPLGGGTDAPYGDPDPWLAMTAAVNRKTAKGQYLGEDEALTPEQALKLFTTHPAEPGADERSIAVGIDADLCLLSLPWSQARNSLRKEKVALTLSAGKIIYSNNSIFQNPGS
ncbi:MAG: amidohydrolase family protein [Pseudomonadales bacterium]|nr:amidohydrolase family protein [Pseudomonadales bacterium]